MQNDKKENPTAPVQEELNLMDRLAGWKTSEFWLTLLTVVFSLFYLFKGRTDQLHETMPVLQQTAEGIALLITNFAVIFRYIKSRENIKTTTIEQSVKLKTANNKEEVKNESTTTKNI